MLVVFDGFPFFLLLQRKKSTERQIPNSELSYSTSNFNAVFRKNDDLYGLLMFWKNDDLYGLLMDLKCFAILFRKGV